MNRPLTRLRKGCGRRTEATFLACSFTSVDGKVLVRGYNVYHVGWADVITRQKLEDDRFRSS
jgi:hypothetical protein